MRGCIGPVNKSHPQKNKFREKREKIEVLQKELHAQIKLLQEHCDHQDDLTHEYQGSSDGWSRSDDDYWIDWHCNDCGKRWTTSQENSYELTTVVFPNSKRIRR
jgi:hypothetical protein